MLKNRLVYLLVREVLTYPPVVGMIILIRAATYSWEVKTQ
jgi:hypothetical protein